MKHTTENSPIGFQIMLLILLALIQEGTSQAQVNSTSNSTRLAISMASEGLAESAALEFRRQALDAKSNQEAAGFYWAAGYEYWKAGRKELAEKMLDRSDDKAEGQCPPRQLLSGEVAMSAKLYDESAYHLEGLLRSDCPADYRQYAVRRLAVTQLRRNNQAEANKTLMSVEKPPQEGLAALETYRQGHDKSPVLGGLLGIIPGLGYIYSGEYANGARSVILNGLFIWGMVSTANRDEWGFFGVITFGEITWYTGSIYGGIDSAARYNSGRLTDCENGIMGKASFTPDWSRIPLIELKFDF